MSLDERLKMSLLEKELQAYVPALGRAADTIIEENVSDYPIFIVHQQELAAGLPIIERGKVQGNWSVNASTLEEFVTKRLIDPDQVDEFKDVYKAPGAYVCLFVLSELGATFVFLPRT